MKNIYKSVSMVMSGWNKIQRVWYINNIPVVGVGKDEKKKALTSFLHITLFLQGITRF